MKLSSKMVNSDESLQVGESMWMFNHRVAVDVERDEASVRSSVKSERKEGFGLGGR